MKRVLALALALMLALALVACGSGTVDLEASSPAASTPAASDSTGGSTSTPADAAGMKVGVIFTVAGLGDNNFNDMVFDGMKKAESDLGVTFEYAEPSSDGEIMSMMHGFAQDGSYDVILGLSPEGATAMEEVAGQYPEQMFTLIDASVDLPNVRSMVKVAPEQCFLPGVLAGLMTTYQGDELEFINEQKVVGAVIGADFPIPRAMAAGFACGARLYDPEVEVLEAIVGDFSDVNKMKELSLNLYEKGADVIQNVAGSGLGIFTAAEEKGYYCTGAGANQNASYPDHIVATAGFVLTELVYQDCKDWLDGNWEAGVVLNPGLKDNAFEYLTEGSNVAIPAEILQKVEAARDWYVEGDITLPMTVDEVDAWVQQYGGSLA